MRTKRHAAKHDDSHNILNFGVAVINSDDSVNYSSVNSDLLGKHHDASRNLTNIHSDTSPLTILPPGKQFCIYWESLPFAGYPSIYNRFYAASQTSCFSLFTSFI